MSISETLFSALSDRRGAAGVEFALLLPPLTLFVIGMVDVGCLAYQQMEVVAAVNAGAKYAGANPGNPTGITAAVTNATPMTLSPAPTATTVYACNTNGALSFVASPTVTCPGGGTAATYIQVNAWANYTPLIAWSGLTMPSALSAQAIVRAQ
jgi:Flp pilus assembly protein TadG